MSYEEFIYNECNDDEQEVRGTARPTVFEIGALGQLRRAHLVADIRLDDGRVVDDALYAAIRDEELARLGGAGEGRLGEAAEILDTLVLTDTPPDFLTLPAYGRLD